MDYLSSLDLLRKLRVEQEREAEREALHARHQAEDDAARQQREQELSVPLEFEAVPVPSNEREDPMPQPRRGLANSEKQCTAWLAGLMERTPQPVKPKAEYLREAKERFPGLSSRGFLRAWANALLVSGNAQWSRPGRKS